MVIISRQTGFTLIEVMVVVVIVGILAAIGIPNFLRYRALAMQAEARSNLGAIYVGEVSFFTERKEFGNFTDIGFAITGGTNRYTYRTGLGNGAGLGPNGGNLCGPPSGSCDTVQTWIPAVGAVAFTGSVGIATTSTSGFTATAAADLDSDATHDGWYVNDAKEGLTSAEPNDVAS